MGNRKRHSKQPVNIQPTDLKIGDSVVVKTGVNDPDYGGDISGWQGRISELMGDDKGKPTVMIVWDSQTLKKISASWIKKCERDGYSWEEMGVYAHEVEHAQPRDTPEDVEQAVEEISASFSWAYLGKEGDRIQKVLDGVDEDNEMTAFYAWKDYLEKKLRFPFEAEVSEIQERGPLQAGDQVTVIGIEDVEDLYGILVKITSRKGSFVFPLCDLKAASTKSHNYEPLDDYDVWFANR